MKHLLLRLMLISGVILSMDCSAQRFDQVFNVPNNNMIYDLAANDTYVYAATGGSGMFRSADNGATWTPCNNGTPGGYIYTILASADTLYAGSFGTVYRSTDNGDSWTGPYLNLSLNDNVLALAKNMQYVFAGVKQKGVYRAGINSGTWSAKNSGLHNQATVNHLFYKDGLLFASTDLGLYRSTDNANSWQALNDIPGIQVNELYSHANNIFAATTAGVYLSTDLGANWTKVLSNIPAGDNFVCLTSLDNVIFAGNGASGVYMSTGAAAFWTPYTASGAACCPFLELVTFKGFVFSGHSAGGILRYPDGIVSVPEEQETQSAVRIYPNPASADLVIEGTGSYQLLSVDGKEIVSGQVDGKTEIVINGLAKGLYLLRYQSAKHSEIKRVFKH